MAVKGVTPVNSTGRRRSLVRTASASTLLMLVLFLLVVPASSAMAACLPTDPLCVVEEGREQDRAPPLPPVEDVGEPVKDAADTVTGEAGKVVGTVTDAPDDLVNPGGDPPTGDGGNDGGIGGAGGTGGGSTDPSDPAVGGGGPGASTSGASLSGSSVPAPDASSPSRMAFRDQPGVLGRIGGAAGKVARQIGFPLALALIVFAFAAIQNYLDRKDPKLALAPVRPEVMRFE
jgi:hypothetical protein